MDKLKYIFSFVLCYLIFRSIYIYYITEKFNEHLSEPVATLAGTKLYYGINQNGSNIPWSNAIMNTLQKYDRFVSKNIKTSTIPTSGQLIVNPGYTAYIYNNGSTMALDSQICTGTTTITKPTLYFIVIAVTPLGLPPAIIPSSTTTTYLSIYTADYNDPLSKITPQLNNEVYYVGPATYTQTQAQEQCVKYNGTLANIAQLTAAQKLGAQWCLYGWLSDSQSTMWPMQAAKSECGNSGLNTVNKTTAGATCWGIKPLNGIDSNISAFNSTTNNWNAPYVKKSSSLSVMMTQPNGSLSPLPCDSTLCKINCNITYAPSGSCVLVPKT